MNILGIDVGGSGIKGAPVDIAEGCLAAERLRIPTPHHATPDAVGDVIADIARHFDWSGPIGCAFPAVIKGGVARTAANIDASWIGTHAEAVIADKTGCPVAALNDADAAGLAEIEFGPAENRRGVTILLTLGTGIGSAIFVGGRLVPNTEFGHLEIRKKEAEDRASDRVRKEKDLHWKEWAERVNEFLGRMEALLWPDRFIIGGGVSKKHDKFFQHLDTRAEVVPAMLLNEAGIIGAALAARRHAGTQQ